MYSLTAFYQKILHLLFLSLQSYAKVTEYKKGHNSETLFRRLLFDAQHSSPRVWVPTRITDILPTTKNSVILVVDCTSRYL